MPESLSPVARGNIVVAMAPHVSRFVSALFGVGADAEALVAATRAYDVLFRFKIDFVRRRALPLLKGGAHVEATAEDHALAESILDARLSRRPRARGATSRRGDAARRLRLLAARSRSHSQGYGARRRQGGGRRRDRIAEALVRRARPRSALSRLGRVPLPREPRLRPSRPDPAARIRSCRRRWSGPTRSCAAATASS